jgi:hypothetical protein
MSRFGSQSAEFFFRSQAISGEIWRKIAAKRGKTRKSPDMMKAGARLKPSRFQLVLSRDLLSASMRNRYACRRRVCET